MKKFLTFLMAMIMLLALVACGGNGTGPVDSSNGSGDPLNIWNGVQGDLIEFGLTVDGDELTVALKRDGSCYVYRQIAQAKTAADLNHPELDARLSGYLTNYGSYEAKEGAITATLESREYYRVVTSGKDGDALKDAYFKDNNMGEEYREAYYGKGLPYSEKKGTFVIVSNFDGKAYTFASSTEYDENGVKESAIIANADGSYNQTYYYSDGTVEDISYYDSNADVVKRESYNEAGVLQYVDNIVHEEGRSVTTRTDTKGNVLQTSESKHKKYENGGFYSEDTVVENGITVEHRIYVEKYGADGFKSVTYTLDEERDGSKYRYRAEYTDHNNTENNFYLEKKTVDGVLTYYDCRIDRVTVMDVVSGRQDVRYDPDEKKYTLTVEYVDKSGNHFEQHFYYPENEYVHGEWEKFEYVID